MATSRHRLICLFCLVSDCRAGIGPRRPPSEASEPGRFDYYVLVLGWTPSYCATEGNRRHDRQCDAERPHAFTLHGLWPQNIEGWPEDCRMRKRPWVPQSVIDDLRDIMPSKNLIIHEYRTHGTCSGLEPAQYFGLARDLYERVSIPPRFSGADARAHAQPSSEIETSSSKSNAWLKPNMIVVSCRGAEPARRAHLLRPRPLSEAMRTERRASGLPRRRDQRAGGETATEHQRKLEAVDQRAAIGVHVGIVFHVAAGIGHRIGIEVGELIVEARAPIRIDRDFGATAYAPAEERCRRPSLRQVLSPADRHRPTPRRR